MKLTRFLFSRRFKVIVTPLSSDKMNTSARVLIMELRSLSNVVKIKCSQFHMFFFLVIGTMFLNRGD